MRNGIEAMITDITATTAEAEDYTGEDGLLYCGKCHTPKEAYFAEGKISVCGFLPLSCSNVQFRIAGSVKPRRFKSSTFSRCFCRLSAACCFSRAARWQSHSDGCRSCPNHWAVSFEK